MQAEPKSVRKSQTVLGISGGRRRRPRQRGAQGSKSRYSWNRGDLKVEQSVGPGFLVAQT